MSILQPAQYWIDRDDGDPLINLPVESVDEMEEAQFFDKIEDLIPGRLYMVWDPYGFPSVWRWMPNFKPRDIDDRENIWLDDHNQTVAARHCWGIYQYVYGPVPRTEQVRPFKSYEGMVSVMAAVPNGPPRSPTWMAWSITGASLGTRRQSAPSELTGAGLGG